MYDARFTVDSALTPAALAAGINSATYGIPSLLQLTGNTNTIAQASIVPDDFSGSSSFPNVSLDLGTGGSGSTIGVTTTNGGGGETIVTVIREKADGHGNDFSKLRAIHLSARLATPGSAGACKLLAVFGDLSAGAWERAAMPLGFDSTLNPDFPSQSEALLILPRAHTYNASHPFVLTVYAASNTLLIASFLGK